MPQVWDLNCVYPARARDAESIVFTAMHLGYAGIAWNIEVPAKKVVACAIQLVNLDDLLKKQDKKALKLPQYSLLRIQRESRTFQQKTRITVLLEDMKDAEMLSTKKALFQSYDIIAVKPKNDKMFQYACANLDVDIISYDFGEDLRFQFKYSTVGSAISRGVVHEVRYAPMIRDSVNRARLFGDVLYLLRTCKQKGVVVSSGCESAIDMRSAHDIQNLMLVFGFSVSQSIAAVCTLPGDTVLHAESRGSHKTAIKVQKISEMDAADLWKVKATAIIEEE